MKWKIHERLALAFYAVLGTLGCVALGYYGIGLYMGAFTWWWPRVSHTVGAIGVLVVAALLLAWSIRVLLLAFKREPKHDKGSVTVQHTDQGNGEVRISVTALDALVKQAIVGNSEGVADIKTHIVNHEDSISVRIEMALNSDVHIPNATMLLQSAIKNFIEEFSGIAVRDVSIMVTTIIPIPPQLAISEKAAEKSEPALVLAGDEEAEPAPQPSSEPLPEEAKAPEEAEPEAPLAEEEAAFEEFAPQGEEPEAESEVSDGELSEEAQAEESDERR